MAVSVNGEVDINATPSEVLAFIGEFEKYPDWSEGHKKASIDTRHEDGRPARVSMTVSAMGFTDNQVVDYEWDGDKSVSWNLVSGTQQKSQVGSYTVTPNADGGSHVRFEVSVVTLMPAPDFLLKQTLKPAVANATEGLKKALEAQK